MSERASAPIGKASGILTITPHDGSREIQLDTVRCEHCGATWVWQPGSGKKRGYCLRCDGFICGPQCAACVPEEQLLENLEAGRAADHRPVKIFLG